jgi:hypothetical protein
MSPLFSNAGLPMIFWQMPAAAVIFVPLVLIEYLVAWRILKQPFRRVVLGITKANALSTFVGVPAAWIGMVLVNLATTGGLAYSFDTPWSAFQSVVLQAAWLLPHEGQMLWLVPAAALVLLVPYFLASVFLEVWVMRRTFPDVDSGNVCQAAWLVNSLSYSGLAAYTAFWLLRALAGGSAGA